MRFVGIDIGGERHAVAVVNDDGALLVKSTLLGEEAVGYQRLRELLGNLLALRMDKGCVSAGRWAVFLGFSFVPEVR